MLILNGNLKGTEYNESQVNAKVLIEAFGIPPMNGKPKTFRLIQGAGAMRKDRSNPGEILVSPGQMKNPVFTINTHDGTLSVRYCTQRTIIPGGNGAVRYLPKKLSFIKGESQFYFGPERVEEYVWAYLHPDNKRSPFRKPNKPPMYEYFDPEEDAKRDMAFMAKKVELMQEITLMPENDVRMRGAGLTYLVDAKRISFPFAANKNISDAVVRAKLIECLNNHGQRFIDAWEASGNSVVGVVKLAENLNIIVQSSITGGFEWRFHSNFGGTRICTGTKEQDPIGVIVNEVTGQYDKYMTKLKHLIEVASDNSTPGEPSKKEPAKIVEKVVEVEKIVYRDAAPKGSLGKIELDELPNVEFVEYAEKKEVIGIERKDKQVFLLNRKTGALVRPLLKVQEVGGWREEFAAFLNEEEGKAVRIEMTAALVKIKE